MANVFSGAAGTVGTGQGGVVVSKPKMMLQTPAKVVQKLMEKRGKKRASLLKAKSESRGVQTDGKVRR
jgi:hypothetical protein